MDENGRDRANLDKCFWQNKTEPFQRIALKIGENTLKLFTRSTVKEFYLDLALARLERAIPESHHIQFYKRDSVSLGEKIIML